MSLIRLVVKNIVGSGFRSAAIFLGAALVAGFAILATLVVRGAEASLQRSLDRLGADIVVFPWGTRLEEMQGGHLMKITTSGWIPSSYVHRLSTVPGIEAISPQLYLLTVQGTAYCSMPEMYVVAFDPATDFILQSWIDARLYRDLQVGEAIGGSHVFDPGGGLALEGYPLKLVGNLATTGTDLDQTLFVSLETAQDMAQFSQMHPTNAIKIVPQSVTTALVRVKHGNEPRSVAIQISERVPGVIPIENVGMFQAQRGQIIGLMTTVLGLLVTIWLLAIGFVGLVFTMTVNARRREIGVLRAIGCPQTFVVRSLLLEGAVLGLGGGSVGIALSALGAFVLQDRIVQSLRLPFVFPALDSILILALGGLALAMLSVAIAALFPALRISRQEPALTMRE
ncbi:MAG TPA: FtsX-like permease family protein [Anaerolineae bacterium]|nr:FtsX-like permease family protein [Anaerolineae bacterium]